MVQDSRAWAAPLPRSLGDRLRALAAPILLVVIALIGVYRSATLDQSSWQGASFGMFATYENDISRHVTVTLSSSQRVVRISLPADLDDDARRLEVVPTAANAADLAEAVRERIDPGGGHRIDVEVWRVVLTDVNGLRLHIERITAGAAAT